MVQGRTFREKGNNWKALLTLSVFPGKTFSVRRQSSEMRKMAVERESNS